MHAHTAPWRWTAAPGPPTLRVMLRALVLALVFAGPPAPEATDPSQSTTPTGDSDEPAEPAEPAEPQSPGTEPESNPNLGSGGVGGSLVDPNDPNAQRAKSDLEGEALDANREGVPERMRPLQQAGWWTMLGTLTLASAGGVLAGLAERQEQEARRLALGIDLDRGARFVYSDVESNYSDMLRRGRQYQTSSRVLFIASAVTLASSVTLFSIDAKRRRDEARVAHLRIGAGAMEVSF